MLKMAKLEFENHKNQYFSWLLRSEHFKINIFGNRMTKLTGGITLMSMNMMTMELKLMLIFDDDDDGYSYVAEGDDNENNVEYDDDLYIMTTQSVCVCCLLTVFHGFW